MMKHRLLPALALIILTGTTYGQTNSYFQNGPVWQVRSACSLPPSNCAAYEYYNYYLKGDTTLGNLVYKKFFKKGYGYYWPKVPGIPASCPASYQYMDTVPSFFLRSSGKQMFIRQKGASGDQLLYDFNLKVGDTLPATYNHGNESDITVTGIDSVQTPYGYRKKFILSTNTNIEYLLEGVGHSQGLVEPMVPVFDCGYTLQCYSLNGTTYFPSSGPACNLSIGIADNMQVTAALFPNPFNTSATIRFGSILNGAQLEVYNAVGQLQRSLDFSGEQVEVERGGLNCGLYFFVAKQDGTKIATGKLIVSD
jgi:hypothetical protein